MIQVQNYETASPGVKRCIEYFRKRIFDRLFIQEGYWIAGGAVRDVMSVGQAEGDIDLFFPNEKTMRQIQRDSYWFQKHKKPPVENERVIKTNTRVGKYDFVKMYFDTPLQTIEAFDFTVCCAAVDYDNLYFHPDFFIDLAAKRLQINALPYPLATLTRLQRYIKKGFTACNGTLLTLAKELGKIDFDDKAQNVLSFNADGTPRIVYFD